MEWVIYLFLVSVTLFACGLIVRYRKKRDATALEEEIDRDFKEDFACDKTGQLTDKGMEDMLDWLEEQDRAEQMEGLDEVDDR
jgi:hypothetical protein